MSLMQRRHLLKWLASAPIGAALAGCSNTMGFDAGLGDAGMSDAGMPGSDGGMTDAGAPVCELTERDALGPFYESGAPTRMMIAAPSEAGDRLLVEGTLHDVADCRRALGGYVVDVWQADVNGNYYAAGSTDYRLRGRVVTGADGRFAFETIKPGYYETAAGPRPAHLHLRVFDTSGNDKLVTQIYFEGDDFLGANDGCQPPTCHSDDPARILRLDPAMVSGQSGFRSMLRLVTAR
jgi:protocatechuate 3,4-dioxygenase beta subunit